MRRALVRAPRARLGVTCARAYSPRFASRAAAASLFLALAGCGSKKSDEAPPLGFAFDSVSTDTALLAAGQPLLTGFEPYRASNGALRVRGRFALPDGARLQVSVRRGADGKEVGREQVLIHAGGFDTPPFPAPDGKPLASGDYRFEISTQFNSVWQPENVLAETRSGLALKGPGMRRGPRGEAVYRLTMEKSL